MPTPSNISKSMSANRCKDTKPELIVRKFLWRLGYRYRLNHKRLPGKPDIVLRKYHVCIFVTAAFGTGTATASIIKRLSRTKTIGFRKYAATKSATKPCSGSWRKWVGIASRFGNAS